MYLFVVYVMVLICKSGYYKAYEKSKKHNKN